MVANLRTRFGFILTLFFVAITCGGTVPPPGALHSPPPRAGTAPCPPTAAETTLVQRLAAGGVKVTAASGSTGEGLLPKAANVCFMEVGKDSFEVGFFADSATASAVRVCETRSGRRFLYQLDDRTMDAAYPLYWSVTAATLIWTTEAELDASLRRILNGVRPLC